jgi:transcriptional regulator with XRE-family HTH domain
MLTPGQYLAARRRAAGLSVDDVAAAVDTVPHLGEIDRRAWIERIEADVAAIGHDVQHALLAAFPFSLPVLRQLADLRSYGVAAGAPLRLCAVCACSEFDPCVIEDATGVCDTCDWHSATLCTACAAGDAREIARSVAA